MSDRPSDRLMTMKDVAEYLQMSLSWVEHQWPTFLSHGVMPLRLGSGPKAPVRFRLSQIEKMLDAFAVVQKGR